MQGQDLDLLMIMKQTDPTTVKGSKILLFLSLSFPFPTHFPQHPLFFKQITGNQEEEVKGGVVVQGEEVGGGGVLIHGRKLTDLGKTLIQLIILILVGGLVLLGLYFLFIYLFMIMVLFIFCF